MSEIRTLSSHDFDLFVQIIGSAYPAMHVNTAEEKERSRQQMLTAAEQPTVHYYGLFREGELLGGMRLDDFEMNFLGVRLKAGGVGMVAVDLAHKKEHVAKEMIQFFTRHYRERGAPLTMLYPFRPDFYKEMGFGYGTKMNQYRIKPAALPQGPSKAHVRFLTADDQPVMLECYHRFARRTHGMIDRPAYILANWFNRPTLRFVGCEIEGQLRGYLVFFFEEGASFLINDLHIRELVYEDREALAELLTFLRSQADQVRHIVLETQDEGWHHLLLDPRDAAPEVIPHVYHETNVQGTGLMYRVVDTPAIISALRPHNFGGQTLRLKTTITDTFLPENDGSTVIAFQDGYPYVVPEEDADVEICMQVAEFSSLLAGTVNFERLYRYGLADISDGRYLATVDRIFRVEEKPVCMTAF